MIATLYQQHELFAGGVFAAANHAASFCRQVDVISCLGAADSHEEMIRASLRPNVGLEVLHRPDAPTTRKCRFIDVGVSMKKLFEVYFMDDQPLPGPQARQLEAMIAERAGDYDLVVVTDFGHGLLGRGAIRQLTERAPFLAVNAQSNSANHGFNLITKWRRADYICIDGAEARLAAQDKHADLSEIVETVLPEAIDCSNIVVTQGKHGCLTFRRDSGLQRVPALTGSIVDTVGAGDAFFAVSAPMVRAGASMTDIGLLGNAAGAIKVGIVGHRASVEKVAMIKFLTALLK